MIEDILRYGGLVYAIIAGLVVLGMMVITVVGVLRGGGNFFMRWLRIIRSIATESHPLDGPFDRDGYRRYHDYTYADFERRGIYYSANGRIWPWQEMRPELCLRYSFHTGEWYWCDRAGSRLAPKHWPEDDDGHPIPASEDVAPEPVRRWLEDQIRARSGRSTDPDFG